MSIGMRTSARTPLVTLHGFTQNRHCWGEFGRNLDVALACTHVELPGHGSEPIDPDGDLWRTADQFARRYGPTAWLGYSLGGRLALHIAAAHPGAVRRLVLIGANPGIEDPVERTERRNRDRELAHRLETDGLPAFLDGWLSQPMFSRLNDNASARAQRLSNDAAQLATSLRAMGTGSQDSLWGHLPHLRMPLLAISGERDPKFCDLAERMVAAWGGPARHITVEDSGHACHLERPDRVADVVLSWLEQPDPAAT